MKKYILAGIVLLSTTFCSHKIPKSMLPELKIMISNSTTSNGGTNTNTNTGTSTNTPDGTVVAPTFSPVAGTYNTDQSVTITSDTAGATIYYTLDGTTPTTSSTQYVGVISVAGHGTSKTINAIAVKVGMTSSSVASAVYTIDYNAVTQPTFSPVAGTYNTDQSVTISSTAGATIYYTLDGTAPTTSSTQYVGVISIAGNGTSKTIKAIAVKSGMTSSSIGSSAYTINYDAVTQPTFSPVAGTYNTDQSVTISSTAGTTIYYTLDGTTPTTSSTQYIGAIPVAGNGTSKTIKAIAVKSGMTSSSVTSVVYTIDYDAVTQPTFSPVAGTYNTDQSVTISSTAGATIYYTLDGTTPTTSSTQYVGTIPVAGHGTSKTIKAIAVKAGMTNSSIGSASYTIMYPVATPTFSPAVGYQTTLQNITISTTTAGATIYYTTDGSTPSISSTQYAGAISNVWSLAGKTIKAIAVKTGYADSAVLSGVYSYPPLKTGQTTVYQTGDNGTNQSGVARSYTDNGNGTITDNATGLVWQKCSMGYNNDSSCTDDGNTTNNTATWTDAGTYCSGLSLASKTWRLPTRQELETLLDYTIFNPAVNVTYFPATVNNYYWSSTIFPIDTNRASYVDLGRGSSFVNDKTNTYYVRCVSGASRGYVGNFTDNGNGTIKDNSTGLTWQKCNNGENATDCSGTANSITWTNAVTYCSSLSLASRTWRLPTVNEFKTIIDTTKATSPTIDTTYFPSIVSNFHTTSTSGNATDVWVIGLKDAYWATGLKTGTAHVRCVSGP